MQRQFLMMTKDENGSMLDDTFNGNQRLNNAKHTDEDTSTPNVYLIFLQYICDFGKRQPVTRKKQLVIQHHETITYQSFLSVIKHSATKTTTMNSLQNPNHRSTQVN